MHFKWKPESLIPSTVIISFKKNALLSLAHVLKPLYQLDIPNSKPIFQVISMTFAQSLTATGVYS